MPTKRRRVRPFRPGHDKLPPPCIYDEVAEALCECLRFYVVKRNGRCRLVEKREGRLPACPTDTPPLSPEREAVYQTRALLHEDLFHPDDARYAPHEAWRGRKWGEAVAFRGVVDQRASFNGAGRNGSK
jgi:hypothetical protein